MLNNYISEQSVMKKKNAQHKEKYSNLKLQAVI